MGGVPSCQFYTGKTYRLCEGEKCWGGPTVCTADNDDISHYMCKYAHTVKCTSTNTCKCPTGMTEISKVWDSKTCVGDCSSCTTPKGSFKVAPSCRFASPSYYIFLEGEACWKGNNAVCTADVVTH